MSKETNARKVDKLVAEGDRYVTKGKHAKALKNYMKAQELDPAREELNAKIIETHEKTLGDKTWDLGDFADHVGMVMQQQEKGHPALKQVHAKLTPEWRDVTELIGRLLMQDDDAATAALTEELVAKGEIATRALIDIIVQMKKESEST